MTEVKVGDTVQFHYTGTLRDGTTFDSSRGREPLRVQVGSGQIIPGLDGALPGMVEGETRTVTVPPDQAYGAVVPQARQGVPRGDFPDHIPLEPGTRLEVQGPDGQAMQVVVAEVSDEVVVLDANHPLAGQDLTFEIEIVAIAA
jgi:peptidylprolyl isomerase